MVKLPRFGRVRLPQRLTQRWRAALSAQSAALGFAPCDRAGNCGYSGPPHVQGFAGDALAPEAHSL